MYYVYFIQEGDDGPIKIGHAKHPADRIRALQIGNPRALNLLAAFPGYVRDEIALHKQLAPHNIRSEWFTPCPEVLAEVAKAGSAKLLKSLPDQNSA